jgi:hypothetical protein
MEGGPLYRIEKRIGLNKSRKHEIIRRALLSILFTWVPLLFLCVAQGTAFGHGLTMPFLKDFGAYSRFLVAIPMLLAAETILGPRIAEAAEYFVKSGVVGQKDFSRFDDAVRKGLLLRDSFIAEVVIAILAYAITIGSAHGMPLHSSSWHIIRNAEGASNTWAYWWAIGFCAPLLQFILLRWFWRVFLWFQFLFRMHNLNLELFPTHPDEAAGLGFVGETQRLFAVLLFAYSFAVSGVLANQVVYDTIPLKQFAAPIALYTLLGVIVIVGPLVIFSAQLIQTKRRGLHQYGALATTYTGDFHRKWIRGEDASNEPLLGTADIQSLADLGNSYGFIERMNAIPVDPRTILHLIVAMLLPMTPLLFTVMPPKKVAELLLKLVV